MASKLNLSLEGDASDGESESATKRRRIDDESLVDTVSFSNLPNDCKVNIYSFLPTEDMNSAACCNKDCCEVRAHESLDQRRTGTIVWTARTTEYSFCSKLGEVQGGFTGNRSRLVVVVRERRVDCSEAMASAMDDLADGLRLPEVTSLSCSSIQGGFQGGLTNCIS